MKMMKTTIFAGMLAFMAMPSALGEDELLGRVDASSTIVWPPGSWLVPPGIFPANYTGYPTLSYGTAYFTPVLLPAKSSVTKLAFIIASPTDNSGQIARACLYTSNANGMPANLKVDGGEATLVRDADIPTYNI